MWRAYREAGVAVPDIVSDPNWNEFDMTAVFSEFAPLLCEADAQFKQDYEELMRKLEDAGSPIHQAWTDCDTQTMRAWMEARYPCRTESWAAFRARFLSAPAIAGRLRTRRRSRGLHLRRADLDLGGGFAGRLGQQRHAPGGRDL